jgi:hypothetical protein
MGRDESGTLARLCEHRKARLERYSHGTAAGAGGGLCRAAQDAPAITRAESIALPLPTLEPCSTAWHHAPFA